LPEIIQEADLPPGVVNIITGAGATGAQSSIILHINKIAFTGSTDVGKIIQRAIAGTNKKATLELGGKAANIIFEDAHHLTRQWKVLSMEFSLTRAMCAAQAQDYMYRNQVAKASE
jgi:acyl-CoA reductase-like NAD-dependent aldehyde dehydrogenase